MSGSNTGFTAAAVAIHFWRQTSGGIAVGQLNPSSLTPETTSHALRAVGFVSSAMPEVTREIATNQGDQTVLGQLDLGASSFGTFDIALSTESATLKAMLGNSLVDQTTLTNAYISSPNQLNPTLPTVGVMFSTFYQSQDSATLGTNFYRTVVFPKVTAVYKEAGASQSGGVNPNPVTITCTPTPGNKFPGGNAFSSTQGWTNNRALFYSIVANAPYSMTSFVQNAIATTYTLAYLPTTSQTGAADHIFTVNGTVTAPTSVSTTTGVVTLAAAGTSGQVAVALYQTNFTTA